MSIMYWSNNDVEKHRNRFPTLKLCILQIANTFNQNEFLKFCVFRTCVTPSSVELLEEKDITRQVLLLKVQHVEKENGAGLYLKTLI